MLIHKNPQLICQQINDDYFVCVNPLTKNGIKVISVTQKKILDLFETNIDTEEIAKMTGYEEEQIKKFATILSDKNIVNFSWKFEHDRREKEPAKLDIRIHTTDKCNLRCTYCYIQTKETNKDMDMETQDVLLENIRETVRSHNLKRVRLRFSWWEPTLVIDKRAEKLSVLQEDLKKMGCKLVVSLLTNGTLLDDKKIDLIKEKKRSIGISLDGIWEYQDKNRAYVHGKGSFDDIKGNIDNALKKWLRPGIMTVVSNENLDGLPALTEYLVSQNLHFRYSFIQGKENLDQQKTIEVMEKCYDILGNAIENGYSFSQYHKLCDLKFLQPYMKTCWSGLSGGWIYIDWWVFFCHTQFGQEGKEIGNIHNEKDLLAMVSRHNEQDESLSEECKTCEHHYVCTGWCPLEREWGKDPHCEIYKRLIPKVYTLLGKERLYNILLQEKNVLAKDISEIAQNIDFWSNTKIVPICSKDMLQKIQQQDLGMDYRAKIASQEGFWSMLEGLAFDKDRIRTQVFALVKEEIPIGIVSFVILPKIHIKNQQYFQKGQDGIKKIPAQEAYGWELPDFSIVVGWTKMIDNYRGKFVMQRLSLLEKILEKLKKEAPENTRIEIQAEGQMKSNKNDDSYISYDQLSLDKDMIGKNSKDSSSTVKFAKYLWLKQLDDIFGSRSLGPVFFQKIR